MGSCISHSPPPPPPQLVWQVAKVVDTDGSLAKFEGPVTAREALALASGGRHHCACFLCSADELGFDAPARALAAEEPLQHGQLYFVLPASTLRRPMSGQDMAALAVKASRALAVDAGFATGVSSPSSRRKGGGDREAGKLRKTARVAPLSSSKESQSSEGAWEHQGYEYDGERTVGKKRHGVVRGGRRRHASLQKLSAIAEGRSE
jgi:hypothetical protein